MTKVKITVVKRLDFDTIHAGSDLGCSANLDSVCELFREGQEFVTDMTRVPDGFCPAAFVVDPGTALASPGIVVFNPEFVVVKPAQELYNNCDDRVDWLLGEVEIY